jgi:hypothetical protein
MKAVTQYPLFTPFKARSSSGAPMVTSGLLYVFLGSSVLLFIINCLIN